jgi:transcriptional regulator with XRE-family HTH domain
MDLGYHSKMTQGQISSLERRRMALSATHAARISRALGVRPDALLDEVQPGPDEELRANV